MLITDLSVKRPVLAFVISLLLVAFGLIAIDRLSLREYPDIDPPIVTVEVEYPGAPANIVETRITELVEERIAGIEGIRSIESSSSDGKSNVTIEFSIDRNIDEAANDVRDRVSGIQDNLPDEAEPPEVQKADSNDDVIIWQNLSSDRLSVPELTDYADRYLVDQYSALNGVARVRIGGRLRYAMRIWLDRNALASRNLTVSDVENTLRAENVELPAGTLQLEQQIFKARVDRHFKKPTDFADLVLARGQDGYLVRLRDVARVEKGVEEDRLFFRGNGEPMVGIGVIKQSTANTIEVSAAVKALSAKLTDNLPEGMRITQSYDAAVFVNDSISEVYKTLLIAVICVVLCIYFFLGNARAMLIPAITVPISLTASFILLFALGFSINLLTLLALILAIGLVVDDAIIMVENIVRHIQEEKRPSLSAAFFGARQVGFAIIATTLVLVSVFAPIAFLEGDTGRLFSEFAFGMIAAIVFSSLVALTLAPALASKLLKSDYLKNTQEPHTQKPRLADRLVYAVRLRYLNSLNPCLPATRWVFGVFTLLLLGSFLTYTQIEQEFAPKEDRGAFFVIVSGPEGASYKYIEEYMTEIERRLLPYVEQGEFKRLLVRAPRGFGNIENFNGGFVIIILEDWSKRRSAFTLMNEVREKLADLPGVRAFPVMRQGLGGGTGKPVQFVIGGATYEELNQWQNTLLEEIGKDNPGLLGLDGDYKPTRPQIDVRVLYDRAADLGVTIKEIGTTLETLMGGRTVTTFLDNGEEYDVIVEGERTKQQAFDDIQSIYVRSARTGQLVSLANLVEIYEYGAAETLTRFNRVRAITLEANLADDLTLGEALTYLEEKVSQHLPDYAVIDYKGQSKDLLDASSSMQFVFLVGLLVVFLVLAAQFESFVLPLVVMLTVPLVAGGGLLGLYLTQDSLNIYSQIGLVMLIGLASKNSILIVDFANQLRDQGIEFKTALLEACEVRFRPIVMTGLTTIAGTIPLILSSGAGAETRTSIGVVILFGVIASVVLTLYLVPCAYYLLAKNTKSIGATAKQLQEEIND